MRNKIIFKFCGRIGHKADACSIRGPKLLTPSLRRKMNNYNALHGKEPNESPRNWNIQPPAANFKHRTSTPKTSPVVSAIMGRLNYNAIDIGDVEV